MTNLIPLTPRRGTVLAVAFLALSISTHVMLWIFAPLGLVVAVLAPKSPFLAKDSTVKFILGTALVVWVATLPRGPLSLFGASIWIPRSSAWVTFAAVVVLAIAFKTSNSTKRIHGAIWLLVAVWVVGAGLATILADPETWIDVWALHEDAGLALLSGESPYDGREVPNPMSQFPEGSVYEGYVYPPIPLFTFALTDALIGDSRWFSLLCGAALVWIVRQLSTSPATDALSILFLVTPGWPLMVQLSWTEPLSVLLLAGAMTIRRGGRLRGILVGLFIGSKQYLLATAIPISASWVRRRPAALWAAAGLAGAAYAVGLFFGPEPYLEWVFLFHLNVPPPPLGANVPGLAQMLFGVEIPIPTVLSVAVGVLLGGWVAAAKPRSDASMILGMATTLAIIFLLGYQAFPNYWYVVVGLFVLGVLVEARDGGQMRPSGDDRALQHLGDSVELR